MIKSHLVLRYLCIPAIYREVALSLLHILQIYSFYLPHILHVYLMAPLQIGSIWPKEAFRFVLFYIGKLCKLQLVSLGLHRLHFFLQKLQFVKPINILCVFSFVGSVDAWLGVFSIHPFLLGSGGSFVQFHALYPEGIPSLHCQLWLFADLPKLLNSFLCV